MTALKTTAARCYRRAGGSVVVGKARTPLSRRALSRVVPRHQQDGGARNKWHVVSGISALAGAAGLAITAVTLNNNTAQSEQASNPPSEAHQERPKDALGLPYFSRKEVAAHRHVEDKIWVTYRNGVYDITEFVQSHPGGDRILLAAGGPIDPYWAMYNQHTTKQVLEILSSLRIGTLYPHEEVQTMDFEDPYAQDPERSPVLTVRCEKPFNAETKVELITDNYITPEPLHYVRHHHPVPNISPEEYRLVLAFEDANILQISLDRLKNQFKKKSITATLQCAGNRRHELEKVAPVQGLEWDCGAISTAEWAGAELRDVLAFAGLGDESALIERAGVEHIQFDGNDKPYDASIPVDKALSKFGDVLVAYEMNGKPIPREHGGPVRIIVPGHLAARSVKWCTRITASKNESPSSWQRSGIAYKSTPTSLKSFDGVDPEQLPSIQELPVQSAICLPRAGTQIDAEDGSITVKGWAYSGGGRNILRVDVSADGGETWVPAELGEGSSQKYNKSWAWTFWEAEVDIPPALARPGESVELVCRAVDSSCNQQPERLDSVWNLRGILNNAYHRVQVKLT